MSKAQTDKTLSELKQLVARTKPDFRGHIPAPAPVKTRESVEKAQAAEKKQLAGAATFKAYASTKPKNQLGYTATHCSKATKDVPKRVDDGPQARPRQQPRQQMDERTNQPVMNSVMSWPEERDGFVAEKTRPGLRIFTKKYETSDDQNSFFDASNVRAVRQDLEALTPRHRTALIRQISMANPKFTKDTRLERPREHWDPMSQLMSHAYAAEAQQRPRSRPASATARRKNNVRLVAVMRRQPAENRPWH